MQQPFNVHVATAGFYRIHQKTETRFVYDPIMTRRFWLMKSEPDEYSIKDLERDGQTHWDGVRNHEAKNFMRDKMKKGDRVLFYHSNTNPPGVVGVAEVVREGYPDFTAWDPDDPHYDPRSTKKEPVWYMVDVAFVERFDEIVALDEIKFDPSLEGMYVRKRGMRLSVQPVERGHFERIVQMGQMRTKKSTKKTTKKRRS